MYIQGCSLINFTTIFLNVANFYQIDVKNFTVKNGEFSIQIKSLEVNNNTLILKLSSEVNIKSQTIVMLDGISYKVNYIPFYNSEDFNNAYFRDISLGVSYSKNQCTFRLWSPVASYVNLLIYEKGDPSANDKPQKFKMSEQNGTWSTQVKGNLKGYFYTYEIKVYGNTYETIDPYAVACGINGIRSAIIDLSVTNPSQFKNDKGPEIKSYTDAVIYEMSIRDISIHPDSGIKQKGKFVALAEERTESSKGISTGLNHIVELGVTHVQLMPIFDFSYESIDEKNPYKYNWGYDPQNYNIPEGSYATDPYNPLYRIYEFKKAVLHLHKHNIGVIMDVVYNHAFKYETSTFEKIFPGYYFRQYDDGTVCNGSGCGNDIASERPMVRKFIIDSLLYWAKEYHIDGFRFDLMGLLDIETMNSISNALNNTGRKYILYGEGWNLNTNLPDAQRSTINNNGYLKNIAFFNDAVRDTIKGSVFRAEEKGFVSGKPGIEHIMKYCVTGSTYFSDYTKGLLHSPEQSINYCSCHDNYTLWDKLQLSCPNAEEDELIALNKLADGIILTSIGVPFIHSGAEFCRTKSGVENSYNSTDTINRIDWYRKVKYMNVFEYYKGLIKLRKAHSAFRINHSEDVKKYLSFINSPANTICFILKDHANKDSWKNIIVIYNASKHPVDIAIPYDNWKVVVDKETTGTKVIESFSGSNVSIDSISLKVLYS